MVAAVAVVVNAAQVDLSMPIIRLVASMTLWIVTVWVAAADLAKVDLHQAVVPVMEASLLLSK